MAPCISSRLPLSFDVLKHVCAPCPPQLYGFSSERKMSACVMREASRLGVYNKGAAEWVLKRCSSRAAPDGATVPMSEDDRAKLLQEEVVGMASVGLRCIALTCAELPLADPNRCVCECAVCEYF